MPTSPPMFDAAGPDRKKRLAFVGDSLAKTTEGVNSILLKVWGGQAPYVFSVEGAPARGAAAQPAAGSERLCLKLSTSAPGDYPIRVSVTDRAGNKGAQKFLFQSNIHGRIALTRTGPGEGALTILPHQVNVASTNRGVAWWIAFLTGQRVVAPADLNFGFPGDATGDVLARMAPIEKADCDGYVLILGTNNLNTAASRAALRPDLLEIWRRLLATGRPVVAFPILPRSLVSAESREFIAQANAWMMAEAAALPGLTIHDPSAAFRDPASPTGAPRSGRRPGQNYAYDGLHPMAAGAFALAADLAARWSAPAQQRSAAALSFEKGTGQVSGRVTGRAPDGWLIFTDDGGLRGGDFRVEASPDALSDGSAAVKLAVRGKAWAGDNSFVAARVVLTPEQCAALSPGARLQATCPIEVAAGSDNVGGPYIHLAYTIGDLHYLLQSGNAAAVPELPALDSLPEPAFSGVLGTPLPAPRLGETPKSVTLTVGLTLTSRGLEDIGAQIRLGALSLSSELS